MRSSLLYWLASAWRVFHLSSDRILWNSFLAFIPLFLSIWLFRRARSRSLVWWLIASIFLIFLPNAPYILTDIIHFIAYVRRGYPTSIIILVLIPQYALFIWVGFQAYVLSLLNLVFYLKKQGLKRLIFPIEFLIHLLCAIGIYLGRFLRLNSWDVLASPDEVINGFDDLLHKQPLLITLVIFSMIWILYELFKRINLILCPNLLRTQK
jgi:uncharacterized membrane protein